ncbi:hypothetical protein ABH966_003056 [Lysinibacillus sp. RC46]
MFKLSLFVECQNNEMALIILNDFIKKSTVILPHSMCVQVNLIGKLMDALRLHVISKHQMFLIWERQKKYLKRYQVNGLGIKGEFLLVQISMIEV